MSSNSKSAALPSIVKGKLSTLVQEKKKSPWNGSVKILADKARNVKSTQEVAEEIGILNSEVFLDQGHFGPQANPGGFAKIIFDRIIQYLSGNSEVISRL